MNKNTCIVLPGVEKRVETGTIKFGDDWPGVFIRGDNAFGYTQTLKMALGILNGEIEFDNGFCRFVAEDTIKDLIELFSSCNQGEIEEYKDAGINE